MIYHSNYTQTYLYILFLYKSYWQKIFVRKKVFNLFYHSRNGGFLAYDGDVQEATEKQLKDWLTCEDTLKIIGVIDEVCSVSQDPYQAL